MEQATIKETKTVAQITSEVVERFAATPDPRLREIMQALVRYLHGFVDEVKLQEEEWGEAIQFLTATGQICDDKRQEFILLSDVLGVTMVTDLVTQNKPPGTTESTVLGPFYRAGAPKRAAGDNMSAEDPGTPLILMGRVLDLQGNPIAGAELDTFQAGSTGFYDSQVPELDEMRWRGVYTTDAEGRYLIRTVRPLTIRCRRMARWERFSVPRAGTRGGRRTSTLSSLRRAAKNSLHIYSIPLIPISVRILYSLLKIR